MASTGRAPSVGPAALVERSEHGWDAVRLQAIKDVEDPGHIVSFCGPEQEYFLVDRHFFLARPDLRGAGRTLFGAKPPATRNWAA